VSGPARDRPAQDRPAQDRSAQGRPAQDRSAQDRSAQGRPAQGRSAQDPGASSTRRAVALVLLVVGSLVAVAAIVLLVLDPSGTPMWATLAGALITVWLNVAVLRRERPGAPGR